MSKYPAPVSTDPRPLRMVWVNPRQVCKAGLCLPSGDQMRKAGRLPEGTWLWTGDNRLARVGRYGVRVLSYQETASEITGRIAARAEAAAAARVEEASKGSFSRLKWRLWLLRNKGWFIPLLVLSPLAALSFLGAGC